MSKIRGFLVKHRVNTIFRCFFRRNRSSKGYYRLNPPSPCWRVKSISRFLRWTSNLKTKAKSICCCPSTNSSVPGRVTSGGHMQFGHDPHGKQGQLGRQPVAVPKGHMAVYVGQKDGDFQRVLIPVVYFNHPLFGQLLREAEEEFGYNHPGVITIPCRISEFEHVQTRIKQGQPTRRLLSWKREA